MNELAQQVRSRRLERVKEYLEKEVESAYYWILELLDNDTEKFKLNELKLILTSNAEYIRRIDNMEVKYYLPEFCRWEWKSKFIEQLREKFNNEYGYTFRTYVEEIVGSEKSMIIVISIK